MKHERAIGQTFRPDQVCWIDFETRSGCNLKTAGPYRYATDSTTQPIVLAYAIGDGPVKTWAVSSFRDEALLWRDAPLDLYEFFGQPFGYFAAFNAAFDRAIWNYATDFPLLAVNRIIDVAVQTAPAGLAPKLGEACKQAGAAKKIEAGKGLIELFCLPSSTATPQSHPQQWAEFIHYAGGDILAARSLFKRTMQLPLAEWREYWAAEAVNERGISVDIPFAEAAAALTAEARRRADQEVFSVTRGEVERVTKVKAMKHWLAGILPPAGRDIITSREAEVDEDGVEHPAELTLQRKTIDKALAYCEEIKANPPLDMTSKDLLSVIRAHRVLELRRYGGSTTPAKFNRILEQHVDGVVYGQYKFNGAGMTGRASSTGVQIHNLLRSALPYEHDMIEAVLGGIKYDDLATLGDETPMVRKLSMLIRPTFVAKDGHVFVWSDWSQIEARILPWLAGDEEGALARLDIFREVDADPSLPDIYTRTAAKLSGVHTTAVTKDMRQRGKVAELALGFAGGVGALQAMAAGYGLFLTKDESRVIVDRWRDGNRWCVRLWEQIENAVGRAMMMPGTLQAAGRLTYMFRPNYLGGSLVCILPSGRLLTYRDIRYETLDDLNDKGEVIGKSRYMRCGKPYGRAKLWRGTFVENAVQATAADFLRGTLVRLHDLLDVRLHTHDEILVEVKEDDAEATKALLRVFMQSGFEWSDGLPLMSEETAAPYYTKSGD